MEQEVNANATAPFLLIQKPQELIRLFENLIDQKIREVMTSNIPVKQFYPNEDSPFLSSRDVEKISKVSRQTSMTGESRNCCSLSKLNPGFFSSKNR